MSRISRKQGLVLAAIRAAGSFAAMLTLLLAGCGESVDPPVTITGKVTFEGAPVEEGTVTFEDSASGFANDARLGLGGVYSLSLPEGTYAVSIVPPIVPIDAGPDTPPDEGYKQVANIPERYRDPTTSGLSVPVASGQTEQNLELVP